MPLNTVERTERLTMKRAAATLKQTATNNAAPAIASAISWLSYHTAMGLRSAMYIREKSWSIERMVSLSAAQYYRLGSDASQQSQHTDSSIRFRGTNTPHKRIATLLGGSLLGAWLGADLATRLSHRALYRVIALLLLGIALLLLLAHEPSTAGKPVLIGTAQTMAGVASGFVIGVVASFLGVAGGELLIPTLVLLFGVEIKLAGSLSLAVGLPTMIVGFTRYSRDKSFAVLTRHRGFMLSMAGGSVIGALAGGLLLGVVPSQILVPLLAIILVLSSVKIWRHK